MHALGVPGEASWMHAVGVHVVGVTPVLGCTRPRSGRVVADTLEGAGRSM
jgi:hypothetical protein